jgi:small subunit ribosomal protein S8
MSFNHSVSDLVSRIKNGYLSGKASVLSPVSKIRNNILQILKDEGYISNFVKVKDDNNIDSFLISLKYHNSSPVVNYIEVVSKPGRRIYCQVSNIPLIRNGLGIAIISTSKGVLADHEARTHGLGGEILLKIF